MSGSNIVNIDSAKPQEDSVKTYCDSEAEIKQNPLARQLMMEIANGNQAAFDWMWSFWCFTHLFDDLVDKDKNVKTKDAASTLAYFVSSLSVNPFYLQNAHSLYPLIISACNRWIDGDKLKASEIERDRIHSEVVRCGDVDIYLHIAFLTGGWEHMRKCSENARLYDRFEG